MIRVISKEVFQGTKKRSKNIININISISYKKAVGILIRLNKQAKLPPYLEIFEIEACWSFSKKVVTVQKLVKKIMVF